MAIMCSAGETRGKESRRDDARTLSDARHLLLACLTRESHLDDGELMNPTRCTGMRPTAAIMVAACCVAAGASRETVAQSSGSCPSTTAEPYLVCQVDRAPAAAPRNVAPRYPDMLLQAPDGVPRIVIGTPDREPGAILRFTNAQLLDAQRVVLVALAPA